MQYQIILLFSIAVINSLFSYFVLRGDKSKTSVLFSLVALAVSLWSINLAFFIQTADLNNALLFANAYYLAAAAIPLLFFYFSLFFPEKNHLKWSLTDFFYLIPFLLITLSVFIDKNIILKNIFFEGATKNVTINHTFYLIYGVYFVFFVILSYYRLTKSYKATKVQIERTQIKFIFSGTAISYALGMTYNLFLPYLGNYQEIWLGPVFTLIMVLSLGYAILKHHLFDIKVIATELLTFALWFFILVRTLISETLQDQFINGGLLVATTVLGILLIRSVIKEVETREKIEILAKDLETANERLKELDRMKSEFVSIASHQLRSPLTAIKGYASMVMEGSFGEIGEKAKGAVGRIFESSNHLAAVVEDLLNVTKIEQGGMKYEFIKVDFKKLTLDIIESLRPNIDKAGLKITYGDNAHKTYFVKADYEKIRQVVMNLIDNAVKYTKKGDINVFLNEDNQKGETVLSVTDSGMGIPQELKDRLFEKFSRGNDISKVNTGGSGLGLYVAREIVKAHGGEVWADSKGEGLGSTFYVKLPEFDKEKEVERTNNFAEEL